MIVCLLCCHVSDCVILFPQRVDEPLDVAGEEPSPATEDFDPGQFASEGKPTSKTQPSCPTFLLSLSHVFIIQVLYQLGWDYCSCIR